MSESVGTDGPRVTIEKSCLPCRHCRSVRYRVQGDSGSDVYCDHPNVGGTSIGDTTWKTPDWCPLLADALKRVKEQP